jgi:hypothetical protein
VFVLLTLVALSFRFYLGVLGWKTRADYLARIEGCNKYEYAFFSGGMKELCKVAFSSLFTSNCLEIRQATATSGPKYEYRLKDRVDTSMLNEIEQRIAGRLTQFKPLPLVIAQISTEEQGLYTAYAGKMADLHLIYPGPAFIRHLKSFSAWLLWILTVPFILYLLEDQKLLPPGLLILIVFLMAILAKVPEKISNGLFDAPDAAFPGFFLTGNYVHFFANYEERVESYYGRELSDALEYLPVASCSV